jgi:hypothetical protein
MPASPTICGIGLVGMCSLRSDCWVWLETARSGSVGHAGTDPSFVKVAPSLVLANHQTATYIQCRSRAWQQNALHFCSLRLHFLRVFGLCQPLGLSPAGVSLGAQR